PGHDGRVYDVTGPELHSASRLAALYGELGGRGVAAISLSDDDFVAGLSGNVDSDDDHARYGARLVASLGRSIREGYMAVQADLEPTLARASWRTLRSILESGLSSCPGDGLHDARASLPQAVHPEAPVVLGCGH